MPASAATRAAAWAQKLADLSGAPPIESQRVIATPPSWRHFPATDITWIPAPADPLEVALDYQGNHSNPLLLLFTADAAAPPLELLAAGEPQTPETDLYLRSPFYLYTQGSAYPIEPETGLLSQNVRITRADESSADYVDILTCSHPTNPRALFALANSIANGNNNEVLVIPAWPGVTPEEVTALVEEILIDQAYVREVVLVGFEQTS